MAGRFYGGSARPLERASVGEQESSAKKRRTEDLRLSQVIRLASKATSCESPSDSDASFSLSDDEADEGSGHAASGHCASTVEMERHTDRSRHSPCLSDLEDGSRSDMYLFNSTPLRERSRSSISISSSSSVSTRPSIADMIQQQNSLITALLQKHDTLCETVSVVRDDLLETKAQVARLVDKENEVPRLKVKVKRMYPSALHVSFRSVLG